MTNFIKMKMELRILKSSVIDVDWGRVMGSPFLFHGRKTRRKEGFVHDIGRYIKGRYFSR